MSKARSLGILLAAVVVATLSLAACGGDDSGGNTTAASSTSQATKTTGTSSTGAAATTAAAGATTAAATATAQSNNGGDVTNPCDVVTKSDVEAALGESVNDGEKVTAASIPVSADVTASVTNCSYSAVSGIDSISVDLWAASQADNAIKQMTQFVCSSKESVSGLGDIACWYDSDHGELQLYKGSVFIDIHGTKNGDKTDLLKSLAEKALSRLP